MRGLGVVVSLLLLTLCIASFAQTDAVPAAPTAAGQGAGAVPRLTKFSGTLTSAQGTVGVTFALYSQQTGGAPLWLETQNVTPDERGRYTVNLGASHADGLPVDLFTSGDARWLGVQVEGQAEQPRIMLVSVPYALVSGDAQTLGGKPLSAFVLSGTTTGTGNDGLNYLNTAAVERASTALAVPLVTGGSAGYLGMFTNSTDLGNSTLYQNAMSRVGINTTSPLDTMHVKFTDTSGAYTGYAVQNMGSGAASYSGMLFYDQNGALGQFQGFNNSTHEYRINNMTPNGSINFLINSIPKFYVASSGYIGMGTSAPTFPLEARQARGATYARFGPASNPLFVIANSPHLGFNAYYEGGYKYGSTNPAGYLAFDQDLPGGFSFATAPDGTVDTAATMTARMVVTNNGRVGIGTTNPAQALDVAGNINVSGTINGGLLVVDKMSAGSISLDMHPFGGPIYNIASSSSSAWVFAGPQTTVTTVAGQKMFGSAMAGIGLSSGSTTIDLDLCYQSTSAGATITNFNGNYLTVGVSTTRVSYAATSSTSTSAGTYKVGVCVRVPSGVTLNSNDYSNGWVVVTD